MTPRRPRLARIKVSDDRGVFMISVAAELADMHPQTLRMYEARGLIEPKRSAKGTRLYSHEDVQRLRRIQEMTAELGMNLAGVERVFELEDEVQRMDRRIKALQRDAERAREEMAEEIEAVRRQSRAEVVPYEPGGDLIPARDLKRARLAARRTRRVPRGRDGRPRA